MSDPFKRTRLEQNTNSASHSEETSFLPPIRTSDTSVTTIHPTSPHSLLQSRQGQPSSESTHNGEVAEVSEVSDILNRVEESPCNSCNSCNSNMLQSAHEPPPTELEPQTKSTVMETVNDNTTAPVDSELEAELDRWGLDEELKTNLRAMTPNTRREIINDIVREQQILHASHYVYNNNSHSNGDNFNSIPDFNNSMESSNFANTSFPWMLSNLNHLPASYDTRNTDFRTGNSDNRFNQRSFAPLPHVRELYDSSINNDDTTATTTTNTNTSVSETSHNSNNNVNSRRPRHFSSHGLRTNSSSNNNNVIELDEDHDASIEPLHSFEVSVGSSSDSEAEERTNNNNNNNNTSHAYHRNELTEVDDNNEQEEILEEDQGRAPRRNRRGHRGNTSDEIDFESFMRGAFDVMRPNSTSQGRNRPHREEQRPRRTMVWRRVSPNNNTGNNNHNASTTTSNTTPDFNHHHHHHNGNENNLNRYANRWENSAASSPALVLFQLLNGLHGGGGGIGRQVDFQNLLTVLAESEAQNEYGLLERDVDDMSYEELLELEERMGKVSRGLAPEQIRSVLTEVTHLPNKERCAICLEDCIPEVIPTTVTPSSSTKKDHENNTDSNNSDTTHNSLPSITKKTAGKDKESSKRSHRIIAKSNDKTNNNNSTTTTNSTNSSNVTNGSVRLSSNTAQDEKRNKNENTTENSDCSSSSPSSASTKCVQIISCGHVFHKHCIEQWLRINKTCPVCNQEIPV